MLVLVKSDFSSTCIQPVASAVVVSHSHNTAEGKKVQFWLGNVDGHKSSTALYLHLYPVESGKAMGFPAALGGHLLCQHFVVLAFRQRIR